MDSPATAGSDLLGSAYVSVGVDLNDLRRGLDQGKTDVEKFAATTRTLTFGVDLSAVKSAMAEQYQELGKLYAMAQRGATLSLRADVGEARTAIESLRREASQPIALRIVPPAPVSSPAGQPAVPRLAVPAKLELDVRGLNAQLAEIRRQIVIPPIQVPVEAQKPTHAPQAPAAPLPAPPQRPVLTPPITAENARNMAENIAANPASTPWEKSGADRLNTMAGMLEREGPPDPQHVSEMLRQYARNEQHLSTPLGAAIDIAGRQLLSRVTEPAAAEKLRAETEAQPQSVAPAVREFLAKPPVPRTASDIPEEGVEMTVPAATLREHGWTAMRGTTDDPQRLENAKRHLEEGQRDPVKMVVSPGGRWEPEDGRHHTLAAAETDKPLRVNFLRGAAAMDDPDAMRGIENFYGPQAKTEVTPAPVPSSPRQVGQDQGWKLHLASDEPEEVSKILKAENIRHKVGHSGQEGKDLTAYIGSRDDAERAAKLIEEKAGHLLKPTQGEALKDDIAFTPNVAGRFDIGAADKDFHQYGAKGVPFLNEDMDVFNPVPPEKAYARADKLLRERYGSFFAGTATPTPGQSPVLPAGLPDPALPAPSSTPEAAAPAKVRIEADASEAKAAVAEVRADIAKPESIKVDADTTAAKEAVRKLGREARGQGVKGEEGAKAERPKSAGADGEESATGKPAKRLDQATRDARRAEQESIRAANRIIAANQTPTERLEARVARAAKLRDAGKIAPDIFERETAAAREQFDAAQEEGERNRRPLIRAGRLGRYLTAGFAAGEVARAMGAYRQYNMESMEAGGQPVGVTDFFRSRAGAAADPKAQANAELGLFNQFGFAKMFVDPSGEAEYSVRETLRQADSESQRAEQRRDIGQEVGHAQRTTAIEASGGIEQQRLAAEDLYKVEHEKLQKRREENSAKIAADYQSRRANIDIVAKNELDAPTSAGPLGVSDELTRPAFETAVESRRQANLAAAGVKQAREQKQSEDAIKTLDAEAANKEAIAVHNADASERQRQTESTIKVGGIAGSEEEAKLLLVGKPVEAEKKAFERQYDESTEKLRAKGQAEYDTGNFAESDRTFAEMEARKDAKQPIVDANTQHLQVREDLKNIDVNYQEKEITGSANEAAQRAHGDSAGAAMAELKRTTEERVNLLREEAGAVKDTNEAGRFNTKAAAIETAGKTRGEALQFAQGKLDTETKFGLEAEKQSAIEEQKNHPGAAAAISEVARAKLRIDEAETKDKQATTDAEREKLKADLHATDYRSGAVSMATKTRAEAELQTGFGLDLGRKSEDRRIGRNLLQQGIRDIDKPLMDPRIQAQADALRPVKHEPMPQIQVPRHIREGWRAVPFTRQYEHSQLLGAGTGSGSRSGGKANGPMDRMKAPDTDKLISQLIRIVQNNGRGANSLFAR